MVMGKARGTRIIGGNRIVERLRKDIKDKGSPARLGIIYTGDPEIGEELKKALGDIWQGNHVEPFGPVEAGSILGTHAGPGAGGIAAFWK